MASKISLCIDGRTDIGGRPNNEDAWWAGQVNGAHLLMEPGQHPLTLSADLAPVLLVVSDGIGGSKAGEVASRMVVCTIPDELAREPGEGVPLRSPSVSILAAMDVADKAIKAKASEPGFEGMGATLSLLYFHGAARANWGQSGDSRTYVCRSGKLRQLSSDHSPVSRMRQCGEITEAEARRHPLRHEIDQSLGNPDGPFQPESGSWDVLAGDVFLVCSDGLSDGLWDQDIERILSEVRWPYDVRPSVNRLVDGAKRASGRDNITAVVALAGDRPQGSEEPMGSYFWRRLWRR
jgi:PPM family protein phosphatase